MADTKHTGVSSCCFVLTKKQQLLPTKFIMAGNNDTAKTF